MLLIAYIVSAAAAVGCNLWLPEAFWPYAVLKPLTTWLVIAYAWRRGQPGEARRSALLAGLACRCWAMWRCYGRSRVFCRAWWPFCWPTWPTCGPSPGGCG